MLEIIALIFLTREIGKIAADKGLKPGTWKIYTVLAWIAGEFIGAIIGVLIFGTNNFFSVVLVAIAGAVTGYLILKANLSKRPDLLDDDINQIGMP
jgi:outer membrane lipoprotein SlyB